MGEILLVWWMGRHSQASRRALGDGCSRLGAGALSHLSTSLCGGFLPDHKSRRRLGTVGFRVVWNFAPEANVQDGCIGRQVRNSPIVIFVLHTGECNPCCERPAAI